MKFPNLIFCLDRMIDLPFSQPFYQWLLFLSKRFWETFSIRIQNNLKAIFLIKIILCADQESF